MIDYVLSLVHTSDANAKASLRSRRLQVVGQEKTGARENLPRARPFSLSPATSIQAPATQAMQKQENTRVNYII